VLLQTRDVCESFHTRRCVKFARVDAIRPHPRCLGGMGYEPSGLDLLSIACPRPDADIAIAFGASFSAGSERYAFEFGAPALPPAGVIRLSSAFLLVFRLSADAVPWWHGDSAGAHMPSVRRALRSSDVTNGFFSRSVA
jgi:hypothetical protein